MFFIRLVYVHTSVTNHLKYFTESFIYIKVLRHLPFEACVTSATSMDKIRTTNKSGEHCLQRVPIILIYKLVGYNPLMRALTIELVYNRHFCT